MIISNSCEYKNVLIRTDLHKYVKMLNSYDIRTYQYTLTILYKHV
jgi:hypothetical protein